MNRSTEKICGIIAAVLLAVFVISAAPADAQVNIRLANELNKFERFISANFISGYSLINEKSIKEEGKGYFGGDCSLRKVFFSKSKSDYEKMTTEKAQFKTDATTIIITVDIYPGSKVLEDNIANAHMKEADKKIGDAAWTSSLKADPRLEEKADNYNALQLTAVKSNVQVHIIAYNYVKEPGQDVWNIIYNVAERILSQVR